MVGFDDEISKKYIPIRDAETAIDILNGTLISKLNKNQLLHGGENLLLSTEQACEFGVSVHNVANSHGGKLYIHDDNWVISMKFSKPLMYVSIWKPT